MIPNRRLFILAALFAVGILVVVVRSAQIQILESASLARIGLQRQLQTHRTQVPRGTIYDRYGNVLAVSRLAYLIRVDTRNITDTHAVADVVAQVAGQSVDQMRAKVEAILESSKQTTPTLPNLLLSDVTPQAAFQMTSTLASIQRMGIWADETWARSYPQGALAGPTLGFVNLQPRGYSGVEGYYNDQLNSLTGVRRERTIELQVITHTHPGADLVLTLDLALQAEVEKALAEGVREFKATGGTVIVMETRTGAILASASWPGYDPNAALAIANSDGIERLSDPANRDLYEPGSVIKVATIAAALDRGVVSTTMLFTDTGRFVVSGKTIRNSDLAAHGKVDIEDVLAQSLNVVAAQIAFELGPEAFYQHMQLFGFGRKTGIDLEGEIAGTLRTPSDPEWSKTDLATNSFGQGMTATPYQVINGLNAIANDGVLMQPYVVQQWREVDGNVVTKQPVQVQRVVSPDTARTLREVMAIATRRGTPRAIPEGYSVAGKTGTADWYLRGVKQDTTIVTFVGFIPALAPQLTILVKLDQPTPRWAGQTAVPVFRRVAEQACRLLGIPPDAPER